MSAAALCSSLPYFHLGALDVGIPIQSFGMIVAAGVLIGAALLRRYAEWHGVSDEHIRGLTGWITVSGFIGAHVFDVLAYQWNDLKESPILFIELWKGISSYGGFIGGAIGFAIYVWWKRLPVRLMADIAIVGLLPAFSIGRIGCTVVSDHIGAAVDRAAWYAGLAMNYPADGSLAPITELQRAHPEIVANKHVLAWNLGLIEFLYLVPVNALVLLLAFRKSKQGETAGTWLGRTNAGLLIVLTGVLYAPVRFGLDFLRPEETDPRYLGLTFAQWASFLVFGAAAYVAVKVFANGTPAETVTQTSGEAARRLKLILKEESDASPNDVKDDDGKKTAGKPGKKKD
ncbi:MAG: prolipoprotein diacylglyceryl transferase family protein [Deltaproteobacteria bacterium]